MIEVYCDQGHPRWVVARYDRRVPVFGAGVPLKSADRERGGWVVLEPPQSVRQRRRRDGHEAEFSELLQTQGQGAYLRELALRGDLGQSAPRGNVVRPRGAMREMDEGYSRGPTLPNQCGHRNCTSNARTEGLAMSRLLDLLEARGEKEIRVDVLASALQRQRHAHG